MRWLVNRRQLPVQHWVRQIRVQARLRTGRQVTWGDSSVVDGEEDPYTWDMFADHEFGRIQGQDIDETVAEGEPEDGEELTM